MVRPERLTTPAEREGRARLEGRDVSVAFRGVLALDKVSLALDADVVMGLIGPNGAGKTTLLNVMSGIQAPTHGKVYVDGQATAAQKPHKLASKGIARTFQSGRLFVRLTVLENVAFAGVCFGLRPSVAYARGTRLLSEFGLESMSGAPVSRLSHGLQRVVTVARALVGEPRFLLLDEPAAGLNEFESEALTKQLRDVRARLGCGILIVEHDMAVIMELCDKVHVLDHGGTLGEGTPAEVRKNRAVIEAYLGSVPAQ